MPLTPFHWSVLVFGLLALSFFYLPALVISSALMDIEPFFYGLCYLFVPPGADACLHCFFHTYVGASIIAFVVGFVLVKTRKRLDLAGILFSINQDAVSDLKIYVSSFLAAWSHIFIDSFLYGDMKPLWPLTGENPLLGTIPPIYIYLFTALGLAAFIFLYFMRLAKKK